MKKIPFLFGLLGLLLSVAQPLLAQEAFQRAQRVANILGIGRDGACSSCHAMSSEQTLRRWSRNYFKVMDQCLDNPALSSQEKFACLADPGSDANRPIHAATLGFWSAGVHLNPIAQLMQDALGVEEAAVMQAKLRNTTTMPLRTPTLLTQAQFQEVQDWVEQGMPYLSELISPYQGPTQCESFVSPAIATHVQSMQKFGWKKRNLDRGLFNFACAIDGSGCFRQQKAGQDIFPDVSANRDLAAWKADASAELRVLTELGEDTDYWIRSSADGRFVGYGGAPSGVVDLQSLLTGSELRKISVDAYYDPAFFPDDSAFVFQGDETGICSNSLLKNAQTSSIDFSEDACTTGESVDVPLYQAVGASLDGADYLAVTGEFLSDEGHGQTPLRDARSKLVLQALEYDGVRWKSGNVQTFDSPWELDWGLAPSSRLLLSRMEGRIGDSLQHIGYQIYQLKKDGAYSKELVGRLCFDGLKVGFSYDDRFVVSYGYIKPEHFALLGYSSADDPEFQARLQSGTANVFVFDLWTQTLHRITQMGPGQFALFPHFRSDGWIYFMVYDEKTGTRRLMTANNARLIQEHAPVR